MKIAVITRVATFINDTIDEWEKKGYEVQKAGTYNVDLGRWADVLFFEFIDKEIKIATQCKIGSTKKIIGRLHRCEYYMGMLGRMTREEIRWDKVSTLIITGKYFYDKIMAGPEKGWIGNKCNIIHLRYGVDKERYVYRERKNIDHSISLRTDKDQICNIGWLAKGYTWRKDPIKALSLFYAIRNKYADSKFKMYMAAGGGDRGIPDYWKYLYSTHPTLEQDIIKLRWQGNVNKYLDNIDFFLNTSNNESFCFVIAEAALKGIKPLIWDFEPASTIWPKEWTFFSDQEMFDLMEGPYESEKYRQYIIDNFSLEAQVKEFDKLL